MADKDIEKEHGSPGAISSSPRRPPGWAWPWPGELAGPNAGKPRRRTKRHAPAKIRTADELRVALIGAGEQGRVLLESCLRIPGIRIAAVCDIWSYSQQYASGYLRKYGQTRRSTKTTATAGQGKRPRRGASSPRPTGCTPSTPTPAWKPGSTSTAKKRCPTRSRRRGPWSRPPGAREGSSRSATSAAAIPAISTPSTA